MIDIISKLIFEVRKDPEMEPVLERSSQSEAASS